MMLVFLGVKSKNTAAFSSCSYLERAAPLIAARYGGRINRFSLSSSFFDNMFFCFVQKAFIVELRHLLSADEHLQLVRRWNLISFKLGSQLYFETFSWLKTVLSFFSERIKHLMSLNEWEQALLYAEAAKHDHGRACVLEVRMPLLIPRAICYSCLEQVCRHRHHNVDSCPLLQRTI